LFWFTVNIQYTQQSSVISWTGHVIFRLFFFFVTITCVVNSTDQLVMLRRSLLHFRHRKMSSSIPSFIRPTDWKSAAPEPLPGTVTFAAQPNLPRLPVPDLKQTLDRLKDSLKPIAWSDSEYSSVLSKIDTFANDQGPQLQQRLLTRASEKPHWLEEWWDNIGYLGYRDSVHLYIHSRVVMSNMLLSRSWSMFRITVRIKEYRLPLLVLTFLPDGFDRVAKHLPVSRITRAASIARGAMIFRQQLKQGLIKPDTIKDTPLCMDTYRWETHWMIIHTADYVTQIVGCLTAVGFPTKALTSASLMLPLAIWEILVTSLYCARIVFGKSNLLRVGGF
jgi:hypothetical protein